jgi:uncharacterized protein (TIGR00304 family)
VVDLVTAGLLLIIAGFGVVVLSLASRESGTKTEVRGGGVIMIGPIPIIFGSDARWASLAMVLAIVLILVYFLLWVA